MTTPAPQWTPPSGHDIKVVRTGEWWDAVRTSTTVGEHALRLLGRDCGALIQDNHGPMYWLVRPGAADGWDLPQVRVLGESTAEAGYIGVPPALHRRGPRSRPCGGRLEPARCHRAGRRRDPPGAAYEDRRPQHPAQAIVDRPPESPACPDRCR